MSPRAPPPRRCCFARCCAVARIAGRAGSSPATSTLRERCPGCGLTGCSAARRLLHRRVPAQSRRRRAAVRRSPRGDLHRDLPRDAVGAAAVGWARADARRRGALLSALEGDLAGGRSDLPPGLAQRSWPGTGETERWTREKNYPTSGSERPSAGTLARIPKHLDSRRRARGRRRSPTRRARSATTLCEPAHRIIQQALP